MNNPKIIAPFFIAGLLYEAFFAVPILGWWTALSSWGLYFMIGMVLHIAIYHGAKKEGVPTTAPIVGGIANLLGVIPVLGNILHFVSFLLYLWTLLSLKDYFFNTGTRTSDDMKDDMPSGESFDDHTSAASNIHDAEIIEEKAPIVKDDLTKIEGIGPKIAEIFFAEKITSFEELAKTDLERLKRILENNNLGSHDPTTWPEQSVLARDGKWEELKRWQDILDGGKA